MDTIFEKLVPLRNSAMENAVIVETAVGVRMRRRMDMDRRQVETLELQRRETLGCGDANVDGTGDHECDCDYQREYDDYDYDYGYGYGEDGGDRHDEFTPIVSATTTTVLSPILAPLKTTSEEPPGAERTQCGGPRRAHFASDFD